MLLWLSIGIYQLVDGSHQVKERFVCGKTERLLKIFFLRCQVEGSDSDYRVMKPDQLHRLKTERDLIGRR